MPELPEVESARQVIERAALGREVVAVDDSDTWECRPHAPGEIAAALVGRSLEAAHRRGKTLWCDLSGDGPVLGLHLGMSGRILVAGPDGATSSRGGQGGERSRDAAWWDEGGDYEGTGRGADPSRRQEEWFRFTLSFADGGALRLLDKRRLGRVRLDPDLSALGPDAAEVGREEFRARVGRGTAPVKARLLDQSTLAGVGNLLADQALWQAGLDPRRRCDDLDDDDLDRLRRELRRAVRLAIRHGGVHTGEVVPHRGPGQHCPRCGAAMQRATVGGRTTWWCPDEQR